MSEREELVEEIAVLRAALAAERAKADAFAQLSHELRTLISGVTGITGLLLETELLPEQRDYAKRIRGFSDALVELVNNVLDLSKLEAGKIEIERVDFDVRRAVDEVGELLAERAQAKGLELRDRGGGASGVPSALRGDPGKVRQVLLNLVSNAVKFTDRGEVVLRATVKEDAGGRVVVGIDVRDTGVGISPEGQARLFQPFTQVHAGGGRSFGGSGLGLALARQLVEAMGGTIGVESRLGEGSTFHAAKPFERRLGRARHDQPDPPRRRRRPPRPRRLRERGDPRRPLRDDRGPRRRVRRRGGRRARGAGAPRGRARGAPLRRRAARRQPRRRRGAAPDARRRRGARDAAGRAHVVPRAALPRRRIAATRAADVVARSSAAHSARSSPRYAVRVVTHLAKPVRQSQLHACLWTLMGGAVETVVASDMKLRDPPAPESRRGHKGLGARRGPSWVTPAPGAAMSTVGGHSRLPLRSRSTIGRWSCSWRTTRSTGAWRR